MKLKCLCGYEYEDKFGADGITEKVTGGRPFIELDAKVTTDTGDAYHANQIDVTLYACPACRTVRIGDGWY